MRTHLLRLFLLCCLFSTPAGAEEKIAFRTLTAQDGLSSNQVSVVCRDSKGFLWIGTSEGVCRYDAFRFHAFTTKDGLPGKNVTHIAEDRDGRIWIRTTEGVAYYSYQEDMLMPGSEMLSSMGMDVGETLSLGSSDDLRYLWVASADKLAIYDAQTSTLSDYPVSNSSFFIPTIRRGNMYYSDMGGNLHVIDLESGAHQNLPFPEQMHQAIGSAMPVIYADRKEGLWAYSFNGSILFHFTPEEGWREIKLPGITDYYNRITDIAEDSSGNIWVTTTHHGLYLFDKEANITHLTHDPAVVSSLPGNNLVTLHVDKDDRVWVGNFKLGLSYYDPHSQAIQHFLAGESDDFISFCETQDALYAGTDGSGLLRADSYDTKFEAVETGASIINCIHQDRMGDLWLGTWEDGLVRLGRDGRKKNVYNRKSSGLLSNSIFSIQESRDGSLFLGMFPGAVQRLDPKTGEITTCLDQTGDNLYDLVFLNDSTLVVSLSGGLVGIDINSNGIYTGIPQGIVVDELFTDSRGYLWMTGRRGVWYYDPHTGTLVQLDIEDGLQSDSGRGITEDKGGRIWIATTLGLSSVDLSYGEPFVQNYNQQDGLEWMEFNKRAMITLADGDILAGTPHGFTSITPGKDPNRNFDEITYLTEVLSASGRGRSPVCKPSFDASKIIVKKNMMPLSLHFSCPEFERQNTISLEYKINGRNEQWASMPGHVMELSFLPPGRYDIQVRALNSRRLLSSHIKNLTLVVRPPWYGSWPAMLVYISLLVLALVLFLRHLRRQKELAAALARINKEAGDQKKLMDMKLTFFANISHELRTPLSLIINPLEEFIKRYPQYGSGFLSTARNNAEYLKELIDQLLSFRKIDADAEVMHYMHHDIVTNLKDVFMGYQSIADRRSIEYAFFAYPPVIKMDFDREKMTRILHNLLTNAFKFTPDGGRIEVKVCTEAGQLSLRVADTGPGITETERDKVFDMFYQVEGQYRPQGGSGIGLYLVDQYVKQHKGRVQIGDNSPHGAVFSIWIPLSAEAKPVNDTEKAKDGLITDIQIRKRLPIILEHTILLVDDNLEFLDFLEEALSSSYRILRATGGAEALDIIGKEDVDLVISDVMMPNMNGLELCRAIKGDVRTAGTPVLLLTAKSGEEFQLEGLNQGADEYLSKPFNMDILRMRMERMLENSRKKSPGFEGEIPIEPSKVIVTPMDQQFVEKAVKLVEDNLAEAEFSVEDLASRLNLSRGYLYRKTLKLTGKTPIEFIRTIRMKRAQQLLAESQLQIAEVAYKLGYRSPKTFSRHFHATFGVNPSQYIKGWKETADK